MSELDLVSMNLELTIAYLKDCEEDLQEMIEKLNKASENIKELREDSDIEL